MYNSLLDVDLSVISLEDLIKFPDWCLYFFNRIQEMMSLVATHPQIKQKIQTKLKIQSL